jgi:hypothetical protein
MIKAYSSGPKGPTFKPRLFPTDAAEQAVM